MYPSGPRFLLNFKDGILKNFCNSYKSIQDILDWCAADFIGNEKEIINNISFSIPL